MKRAGEALRGLHGEQARLHLHELHMFNEDLDGEERDGNGDTSRKVGLWRAIRNEIHAWTHGGNWRPETLGSGGAVALDADAKFKWRSQILEKINCFEASRKMIDPFNIKVGSLSVPKDIIQIGRHYYATADAPPATVDRMYLDYLDTHTGVDWAAARQAIDYINAQLDAGKPVIVGVTHAATFDHPPAENRADGVTRHHIVIVGRRTVDGEVVAFTARDPGTSHEALSYVELHLEDGLMVKDGSPTGPRVLDRRYEVTHVRKNYPK
jgi:hypothetical protein